MEQRTWDQVAAVGDLRWRVPDGPPVRLDAFVSQRLAHLSSRQVRALLEEGGCTVNGHRGKRGTMLFPGDRVAFCGDPRYLAKTPIPAEAPLTILFEDDVLIAVDKPSGIATHGHSGKDDGTLANYLLSMRPQLAGIGRSRWEPGILHRLDKDTSGVVLAAKQQTAFEHVRRQFEQRTVGKVYRALVLGRTPAEGRVDYPLTHDPTDRRKMRPYNADRPTARKVWNALTRFRTIGRGDHHSHVEVEIVTGVTHQIRVHMQAIGHPVLGDPLYGDSASRRFDRCMLHAYRLELSHPVRGETVVIRSALPEEFDHL
jgi:23S rRNA pseudouridine1911/1915/1917 synthase